MKTIALIVLATGLLPTLGFQGIAKTTPMTGQTPPPKSRVEPPASELSMGFLPDVSFFTDLMPDVRVLRYIQLTLADSENVPIILSAVSSFLVIAGIWSTTPTDGDSTVPSGQSSPSFSSNLGYASADTGSSVYQATLMEPPTARESTTIPYGQQRSFSRARGMNARGATGYIPPQAAKLPAMQGEARYKPLSYAPMTRPGGISPLKTILTASSSTLENTETIVAATPKQQEVPPKRFSSSKRDVTNSFDGPINPSNKRAFDWVSSQVPSIERAGSTSILSTETRPPPYLKPLSNDQGKQSLKPTSYAPTESLSLSASTTSASSYLESLGGGGSKLKPSSYAPTKSSVTTMQTGNILGNSYFQALSSATPSAPSGSSAELPAAPISQAPSPLSPGAAQLPGAVSYLESIGGGARMKESSYAPTKASVIRKETGNALGSSYFAAMGSGRSAPTTFYQYSPAEIAARAALNPTVTSADIPSASLPQDSYSPDSLGSSDSQGSYLDTVGGTISKAKESSYAPTKPSVMTKPMGNAMGSTYLSSMGVPYFSPEEPEPPTAGAMKSYLSTLTKENPSGARPASYAPTKSKVGKMSSTTVGSSYLQSMGKSSFSTRSEFSVDPGAPSPSPSSNPIRSSTLSSASVASQTVHSDTPAIEARSYLEQLSGGKQSSLPEKRSFAPTQPCVSKKSGTTIGSSYLSSIGR